MVIRNRQGGCDTGEAVITTAGNLPAKFVIHTVGPVWKGGTHGEEQLLENCYLNSLSLAVKNGLKTLAFPNISTGIYGFPKDRAAAVVHRTFSRLPDDVAKNIDAVTFVCFDEENYGLYKAFFG
jgi:O-acetyl-ADP-ribose deacetylase (regulator of RNase III)